jgi:hypothetical protein
MSLLLQSNVLLYTFIYPNDSILLETLKNLYVLYLILIYKNYTIMGVRNIGIDNIVACRPVARKRSRDKQT